MGDRDIDDIAKKLGYTDEQIALGKQGEGSNLGLGCGSPVTFADIKAGETVVDLGSGAGFDTFIAAEEIGPSGQVIGVDMLPDMISSARKNVRQRLDKGGPDNVSFRLGEIEHLPCADDMADVIISNCVINLSLDKAQVMREAYRILKPGGRVAVSDVVAMAELPERLRNDKAHACCVSGAPRLSDLESILLAAGFEDVSITVTEESREIIAGWMPGSGAEDFVASAKICAVKPFKLLASVKSEGVPYLQVCRPPAAPSSEIKTRGG